MGGKSENDEATSAEVEYNVNKRPSRSTAGNRYAKLLQGELEKMKDDFYQETYGGFNEVKKQFAYHVLFLNDAIMVNVTQFADCIKKTLLFVFKLLW